MEEVDEERQMRTAALKNIETIQVARRRAEQELVEAKEALERKSTDLEQQREWFEVTLASIGDGVITTDVRGVVTFLNRAAEVITGWQNSDVRGQPLGKVFEFHDAAARQPARNFIAQLLESGETSAAGDHAWLRTCRGGEIAIEASAAPICSRDNEIVGAVVVFRDVSERRRADKALRRSEQLLTDFFENAAVGLHWVGPDGTVLRANQTELDLLGYTRDEYVGHHIAEFHADPPVIDDILDRLGGGECLQNYEARLRCKDGTFKYVLISSNVLWEDGKFIHTRCFTRDVTAQKLAELALRQADRRKDEFLATLAHELRNPLAPIRQAVAIANVRQATDAQKKWSYDVISRQVLHMSLLLDDLLDASRITQGRLGLRTAMTQLAEVVDAAVETSRPHIEAKGHRLTVEMPPEPVVLAADPLRLAQVLTNLLTNAAKYTDADGSIRLRAVAEAEQITLSVADSGVGIRPEDLSGVFDMFSQVRTGRDRSEGGLGIGLALVKGLVELHGGSVEARSEGEGMGSEFFVRLPRRHVTAAAQLDETSQPGPELAPLSILVADDNEDAAESLAILLRFGGHEVTVVNNGREALTAFGSLQPHVAVLDIGMPQLSGYEVAQQVRQHAEGRAVTLIAVTGWGQETDKARAMAAGFDHHFTKPIEPDALMRLLQTIERRA